jgi:glucose/mannose-6-phosphate isomerase
MTNLDNLSSLKTLDPQNVLGSIELLGQQARQAWEEVSLLKFPVNYSGISNIVFSGMGGSALGAYVVKSLFSQNLTVPFEIINDYSLPYYVNEKTLVMLASYSGTTEETISGAKLALQKKACITGLTTGGLLADFFKKNNLPAYIFKPKFNPSNQPRLGTGYSVFGQISILNALKILNIPAGEVDELMKTLNNGNRNYGINNLTANNPAKQLATKWQQKIPIIVAGEFLTNTGRVIRNQLHESSKCFAAYHDIPELNHHLLEGLTNPKINPQLLSFLFLNSKNYSPKIRQRIAITKDVITQQKIKVNEFNPKSPSKISQAFECIQFGAYVNYYLALLYGVNPSQIPWVDYFKKKLQETS